MSLKVGNKVLIRTTPSKWNGGSEEAIYQGEVVNLDPEQVKIRLLDGEEIDVPLASIVRIEILEAKESIFQRALGMVISFIIEVVCLIDLGVFLAEIWIKERFKKRREK